MSFRIRILHSGREFFAESHETVLEAALRSGINLNYSCASGTCGDCQARVVAGELGEERFHDYVVADARKSQGYTLLCCATAASDLVIDTTEALGTGDIPHQQIPVRVARLERHGTDYLILHLRTPRTRTLRFFAGQCVRLQIPGVASRELSVASCPCNGMMLQFHLRREPQDPFTSHVFERLQVADSLELEGPFGDFTLDEESRRPIVMVASEVGFAPVKSLIEHAIALELPQAIHLYWVAGEPKDIYLDNYCRSWVDALDDFFFTPLIVARDAESGNPWRFVAEEIAARSPRPDQCDLYLSGPGALMEAVRAVFVEGGMPASRVATNCAGRPRA